MKRHEIVFTAIKLPLDFFIIFFSFFIAREIRLITDLIPQINLPIQRISIEDLIPFSIFGALLYIFLLASHSLYSSKMDDSKIKEFWDIVRYSLYWFVFFGFFVYLWDQIIYNVEIPRLIILFTLFIWTTFIIIERIILNNILSFFIKKWVIQKRNLLLVNNKKEKNIKDILDDIQKSNIYKICWYINSKDEKLKNIKYLWNIKSIKNCKIDEILYIDSDFSKKELFELWDYARIFWIRYRYITNSFDITNSNSWLSLINNIPVIELKSTQLWIWGRIIKRLFDLWFSLTILIILSPLLIIIWILIKLEDPKWPIIYKNRRVWQSGKEFELYKFRYLKWEYCIKECYWISEKEDKALKYERKLIEKNSIRTWPLYKIKNDPRKTKIWSFIEKYSIDEIPQFFNVLIWNMSIIWPRPHQVREVNKYKLHQKRLLTIKPWITGMAQVNWREQNNFAKETKLDIFYIENWSFLLDMKIFFKTIPIIFNRK